MKIDDIYAKYDRKKEPTEKVRNRRQTYSALHRNRKKKMKEIENKLKNILKEKILEDKNEKCIEINENNEFIKINDNNNFIEINEDDEDNKIIILNKEEIKNKIKLYNSKKYI